MKFLARIKSFINHNAVFHHTVFWLLSLLALYFIFNDSNDYQSIDLIYTCLFASTLVLSVYTTLNLLVIHFLRKEKYVWFLLTTASNILLFSYLNLLFFNYGVDYILPGYYFISYYSFADVVLFFTAINFIALLLSLAKEWLVLMKESQQIERLEKEKAKAELSALINQINPHFLFNSLNVLYSLALTDSNKTADSIIKLGDVLRYVLYQTKKDRVSIEDEIKLLNDYIFLQQYRSKTAVTIKDTIQNPSCLLPPMLLLPLLENAFKHGNIIDNNSINITISEEKGKVEFYINNQKAQQKPEVEASFGGIGLNNIQQRLLLLYPEKHTFEIKDEAEYFSVKLSVWP